MKRMSTREFVDYLSSNKLNVDFLMLNIDLNITEFLDEIVRKKMSLLESSCGLIGEVQDNGEGVDLSKSSKNFVLHTDGPYHTPPPRLVILHEIKKGNNSTVFTILKDTTKCIEKLSKDDLEILKSIDFLYHSKRGNIRYPLISFDHVRKEWISNFGGKGHLECREENKYDFYTWMEVCNLFFSIVGSKSGVRKFNYSNYSTLVFNNHKYLHGRLNISGERDFERKLYRIWIK